LSNRKIQKKIIWQIFFLVCSFSVVVAQDNSTDTSAFVSNPPINDTLLTPNSDIIDTYNMGNYTDSIENETDNSEENIFKRSLRKSPNAITSIVDYSAKDSVDFNLDSNISTLYNSAELNYEDVNLVSNYVEINFLKRQLFASGDTDTAGTLQGSPVFKQEAYEFKCHELLYNFESKKGLIRDVITREGESYIHGELVKKNEDNSSYIYHGKYTTCNLDCPHYEASFRKGKIIPNDRVITGTLWIRVMGVPIAPFPFGFFPNSNKRKNGILIPQFAQANDKGPGFEGLGYYFVIKDIMDFSITTDIFMRGAFAVGLKSNYVKRYKFNGDYDISYSITPSGEKGLTEEAIKANPSVKPYQTTNDIKVDWRHQQDRRAHPTNNFSANVNFKTATYSKNNIERDINVSAQSKAVSTVNFSTNFKNKYSFGVNAALSQDFVSKELNMNLPQINVGVSQFYPFRRKQIIGKTRWYENISMQYTMDFQNQINTTDSILINHFKEAFENFRTGMNHNIPIKSVIKLFKNINWDNSVQFKETWQIRGVKQSWSDYDSIARSYIHKKDTIGFFPAHDLSLSSGLSTTLYGMYKMKKGRVDAFRHSLSPSVNFTYKPALNRPLFNTYNQESYKSVYDSIRGTYYDSLIVKEIRYSYLDGSLYGTPSYKASGKINFSISNKLEMKVRPKNEDEAFKKVTLIENLTISTSYDLLADSLNWDMLSVSGRTTLFKQINFSIRFAFDPYIIDTNNTRVNKTVLKEHGRLFRFSSSGVDVSFSYNINQNLFNKKEGKTKKVSPSGFEKWNINVSYSFSYNMNDNRDYYLYYYQRNRTDTTILKHTKMFTNTVRLSGEFALTPKWKLNFQTGYDFMQKTISISEFRVERDLHCWLIHFRWVPFGTYRSFEFGIRAKASILQDAKWEPKRELRD